MEKVQREHKHKLKEGDTDHAISRFKYY